MPEVVVITGASRGIGAHATGSVLTVAAGPRP